MHVYIYAYTHTRRIMDLGHNNINKHKSQQEKTNEYLYMILGYYMLLSDVKSLVNIFS